MKKVAVALSGGVDSSLTVLLLRDAGYEVVGVTLRVQRDRSGASVCAGDDAVAKARAVAAYLGIEHRVCDVCDAFRTSILAPSWETYSQGRTPSPCVRCNERIKFGKLFEFALSLGCEKMATGHYARIVDYHGISRIARGADRNKDQSYFLSGLTNEVVSRIMFPLGEYEKPKVRALADSYGLPSAHTPDSQNVCITEPGKTFSETLCDLFDGKPKIGQFIYDGKKLGSHLGIHHYTVGQRHGLGNLIPTQKAYVKAIVGNDVEITADVSSLDTRHLRAKDVIWHAPVPTEGVYAQIRYRSPAVPCRVTCAGDVVSVEFESPVHAVTPGQIVAFYDGDVTIGRGIIDG